MLWMLVRKEMQQLRWVLIIGVILGLGLVGVIVGSFHYLGQLVNEIPSEVLELLARYEFTRELMFIFDDYSLYVWSQWNAKNLYQFATVIALIMAAIQFAGEINNQTMSFYLTRPISRKQGYIAKIAAGLLVMLVIFGGGTLIFWAVSSVMGYVADWGRLLGALLISLAWAWAFYCLASIISLWAREPIKAGVAGGAIALLLSVPGLFPAARPFSIFYQMRAVDYFLHGDPLLWSLISGLAIGGLLLGLGGYLFSKADF